MLPGSTAIVADAEGNKVGEVRYKAFGEDRYTFGTTPTTYRYTGQRQEAALGLYFYNARWYDPFLGRFVQADTLVPGPGEPQSLNRYAYCLGNPLRFIDPTGHRLTDPADPEHDPTIPPPKKTPPVTPTPTVPPPATTPVPTDEERALARMMWGEERSWGELGMSAVGWIAINRLNAGWGSDILDVLTQPGQFQGYSSKDPSPEDPDYALFLQALEIATGILSGDTENYPDPTTGALFFGNGDEIRSEMQAWAEAHPNSGFWYFQVKEGNVITDIWVSNRWYREEE